jgi:hypothetical protein
VSWPPAELQLIEVIAADRAVALRVAERGTLALFSDGPLAQAGQDLIDAWTERGDVRSAFAELPEALAGRLTAVLLGGGPLGEADRMKVAEDCTAWIEQRAQKERRMAMAAELRHAVSSGDEEASSAKLVRLNEMLRREGGPA